MKVAVAGKGGVGKTTLTALLAHEAVRRGYKVVLVDADPAATLAPTLGITQPIQPLTELSELIYTRVGQGLINLNPKVEDIPEQYAVEKDGMKLLVLGGVRKGGSGCACPEYTFLRALLRHLLLRSDEAVFVDLEAGLEPLGRSAVDGVDALLIVVDPDRRSAFTALRIFQLAKDLGLKNVFAVANKIRHEEEEKEIQAILASIIPVILAIPFSSELEAVGKGKPIPLGPFPPIPRLFSFLEGIMETCSE